MYPWICGRCAREFTRANLQELTVHHRNHDHDFNPADGSNWELLCVYCHDNEHSRQMDQPAQRDDRGGRARGRHGQSLREPQVAPRARRMKAQAMRLSVSVPCCSCW